MPAPAMVKAPRAMRAKAGRSPGSPDCPGLPGGGSVSKMILKIILSRRKQLLARTSRQALRPTRIWIAFSLVLAPGLNCGISTSGATRVLSMPGFFDPPKPWRLGILAVHSAVKSGFADDGVARSPAPTR